MSFLFVHLPKLILVLSPLDHVGCKSHYRNCVKVPSLGAPTKRHFDFLSRSCPISAFLLASIFSRKETLQQNSFLL